MRKRGSIDQIENGRFRLRMSVNGVPGTIGFFDTRDEAEREIQVVLDVEKESAKDFEGVTLESFGRKVLTRREVQNEVRDPDNDWSRWNVHVKTDVIAKLAVKRIRPDHLHRWVQRVGAKVGSVLTVRACKTLVSVILSEAVADGIIKANPMREVRVKGKAKDAWTYLRPPEQEKLLAAMSLEDRCPTGFSIGAGLREGELVTLRLDDLHIDVDHPHAIVRYGKPPNLPTKTEKIRHVPLFGMALAAAKSWLEILPRWCPNNPHGLVFPRKRGGFRSEEHVLLWKDWKAAIEAAAIGRRLRWHDLRHTCASSLVSGWWGRRWTILEVKEMLGHDDIENTMRYAHLAESAIERAGAETGLDVSPCQFDPSESAPGVTRTPALLLRKQLLYPTELLGPGDELGKRCSTTKLAEIAGRDRVLTTEPSADSGEGSTGLPAALVLAQSAPVGPVVAALSKAYPVVGRSESDAFEALVSGSAILDGEEFPS